MHPSRVISLIVILTLAAASSFFNISLFSPVSANADLAPAEIEPPRKNSEILDDRLFQFMEFVRQYHMQGLLDGEILIARKGQFILQLKSVPTLAEAAYPTQFQIGSVSKQFFAIALLKALSASFSTESNVTRLAHVQDLLQAPVARFLPETSPIWDGKMPAWTHEVTLHHLLTHTSGIVNYTEYNASGYSNLVDTEMHWFDSYHTPIEIMALIKNEPLQFVPGTKFAYNNTGYLLIAEIIEAITHTPISDYLQNELFDFIGMSSTTNIDRGSWNDLVNFQHLHRLAPPYQYDPTGQISDLYPRLYNEDLSCARGAGSMISSAYDLYLWCQALHKDQSVLPLEIYPLAIRPYTEGYAYGMIIDTGEIGTMIHHQGSIGSFRSFLLYMPEHDLTIVMLSNVGYDFDRLEPEYKQLVQELSDSIPNEDERNKTVLHLLSEKYPPLRGFEVIAKTLAESLF